MSSKNIYSDGTYSRLNPNLHAEDSAYKMHYLGRLFETIDWEQTPIKILDIGGGAGELGKLVCEWFATRGHSVSASVLDVAEELINTQIKNNPYISNTYVGDLDQLGENRFDLALMIDVIEHIENHEQFATKLNKYTTNIAYNIPTEINLFDLLRNFAMRKRYYPLQSESLGHVHFFSAISAARFVARHHEMVVSIHPEYALYVLTAPNKEYVNQPKRLHRKIELIISVALQKLMPWVAPHIIQGSMFCLAKSK